MSVIVRGLMSKISEPVHRSRKISIIVRSLMFNIGETVQHSRNIIAKSLKSNISETFEYYQKMSIIGKSLMENVSEPERHTKNKVTIVGAGNVGMACASAILIQNAADEVVLIDILQDKVQGEIMDLQHGIAFMPNVKISGGTDYAETKNSRICIITAGVRMQIGEKRTDLLTRNLQIIKAIVPHVIKHSPDVILLVVSNPVDILSYAAWKLSGLPAHRVIGSGTNLDTARFRQFVAQKFDINIDSIVMWILGEHGDSSVPIWSSLSIAGVHLLSSSLKESKKFNWDVIHDDVVHSAYEVIKFKGYTSWAIGLSCSDICKSIVQNTNSVRPVSTLAKGLYGITNEVFISLPCVLGQHGLSNVINLQLTEIEASALINSAEKIYKLQAGLYYH